MKKFWDKHHENIITFLLFSVLFIGVLSVIALFSGAVMKLFGFEYKSIGNIILYFIIATFVSCPLSLIAGILPKMLLFRGSLTKQSAVLFYLILDTIATSFGLRVVDYFMETGGNSMEEILVLGALNELAEDLGDSNSNPLSISLLCLRCGITFDQKGMIMVAFNQVLRNIPFDNLEVNDFRKALQEIVPEVKGYAESLIIAFIKAFARNHIAELTPFARTLD